MVMLTRRKLVSGGGSIFAGLALHPPKLQAEAKVIEIHMRSDSDGSHVGFHPVGLLIEPGTIVRWTCDQNVHTTTAYSPKNDNHALRIPENAQPWASDYLLPGQSFEVTLTEEGVYDYFCVPHELAGMVGRIIVGKATGPGSLPFDYFIGEGRPWRKVPPAAQRAFPGIAEIMQEKIVVSPIKF
jgi:plastocyanin